MSYTFTYAMVSETKDRIVVQRVMQTASDMFGAIVTIQCGSDASRLPVIMSTRLMLANNSIRYSI